MTTEAEIFDPYAAYERAVEVLTHEGWGNVPARQDLWKPEASPVGVGLYFTVKVPESRAKRLEIRAYYTGRLSDTFSLATHTGLTVTLSLITDMMRAAKEGSAF